MDIFGCDNIYKYFDAVDSWMLPEECLNSFVISLKGESQSVFVEALKKMWRKKYGLKAGVVNEMGVVKFFTL